MAHALSHPVRHYIEKLKAGHARARHHIEAKTGQAKMALEVVGTGVAVSYLLGRVEQTTGKPMELFGVPVDLAAGLAMVSAGLFGFAGKYDEDALCMGAGTLTAHLARKAYDFGKSAAVEHRFLGMSSVAGAFGASRSVDADLASRLRQAA